MGWNQIELINFCWNYLEQTLFGGTWNRTGRERAPIKNRVERNNKFQFRVGWNGTERVPVQGWVERNGTSSKKIGTEYNTA